MSDFNSPKNTLPDLMPLEDDRSSEVLPQELDAIKMSLMETSWRTKQIVDVLIRHNSLLERDIEKITNLKRRLRRSIGIIPGMPGRAGALFGVGVSAGFLPMGGSGTKPAQPFIPPPRVRTKPPRPQEDTVRVKEDVRVDVKEDVKEDIRVRVPDAQTQTDTQIVPDTQTQTDTQIVPDTSTQKTNEEISGTIEGVLEGATSGTDVIEKELTKGETKTNEERSGTSIWDIPITPGLYPGLEGLLDKDGIGSDIFNPNNPQPAFSWEAFMAMEKGSDIQELEKVDKGIDWWAILDWAAFAGAVAFPGDAVAADLAALANLLIKGRVSWSLLSRFVGKKALQNIYNYMIQQNIDVPKPSWMSGSIKPNSSSFNIASASDSVNSDGLHSHTRKKDTFVIITDQPIA